MALLEIDANGLYCAAGDFYVDPWRGVERAVITHGHSDHARWGSATYLTSAGSVEVVRARVGDEAAITGIPWGETVTQNGVQIRFHPAGHILGSAQVRVEYQGEVWVVSGDYKTEPDATCEPFEPVRCHTFITESTFGLPIYVWRPQQEIFAEVDAWWRANRQQGRTSVVFAYALGKAQRLLAGIDSTIGPIAVHGAVHRFVDLYREAGIALPPVVRGDEVGAAAVRGKGLVIAPPSAANSTWLRKFGEVSTAFASGWMQVRGIRRRRAADRGFVLSDHADWPGLLDTIHATGAERVAVTHGPAVPALVRYLQEERQLEARALVTPYGDDEEVAAPSESPEPSDEQEEAAA
jgi:putative mRNA 3-end processing factor